MEPIYQFKTDIDVYKNIFLFLGETRAELHIDQASVAMSVLKMETQYNKLFKSLFVIFAINYNLLERHLV